eukprot:CAMPEP_0115342466 /NCGR_PEP_ID=MMETSP0270-20121206/92225_1 /TAXON_ID=71861 /ORGANISM="Scrippsiella trochoidea, Strain CCMP3099" /LENGTH=76 /DNA_ID=CAMNT_0002764049 /DNA_START=18 /DNA_END=245 /DNA_ORIENTATION=-
MPKQEGGQDGQCGRAEGDFKVDWLGSRVDALESLLSPKLLLLDASRVAIATNAPNPTYASSKHRADGINATKGIND